MLMNLLPENMLNNSVEVSDLFGNIRRAARDVQPVSGLTHCHYKYPARFSPTFVATAIENFSKPGDLILDPYMGGGTTIVEAMVRNRRAAGCDLNSLAVFITKVKTTVLTKRESGEIVEWAHLVVPKLKYNSNAPDIDDVICKIRTRNLELPRARAIKKFIALALISLDDFSSENAEAFARCALLNVSQWALNGRKQQVSLSDFRAKLTSTTIEMLNATDRYTKSLREIPGRKASPVLIHGSSENIGKHRHFRRGGLADLVITSPPYPGVHVLYHRWQVDGRKETPAPYWIANCLDGQGSAFYNFGKRKQENHDDYFDASLRTLHGIRSVLRDGATMIQMVAFSDPKSQVPRYLNNMASAGFTELDLGCSGFKRIWRSVPRRNWHAELQGNTNSAREVVLIHKAS
jgi:DNA modification methylase